MANLPVKTCRRFSEIFLEDLLTMLRYSWTVFSFVFSPFSGYVFTTDLVVHLRSSQKFFCSPRGFEKSLREAKPLELEFVRGNAIVFSKLRFIQGSSHFGW